MARKSKTRAKKPNDPLPPKKVGQRIAIGLAALGVVLVPLGLSLNGEANLAQSRAGTVLPGLVSLDDVIVKAQLDDVILPLTQGDGSIDLIYAGAPECIHCQRFLQDGFTAMVQSAEARGLDFAYMPIASSAYGLSIAAVEKCALPGATVSAPQIVRAAYAAMADLELAAQEMTRMRNEGAAEETLSDRFDEALSGLHAATGNPDPFDSVCYTAQAEILGPAMDRFVKDFSLQGTPSFWFVDADGRVRRITGAPDLAAIEAAIR